MTSSIVTSNSPSTFQTIFHRTTGPIMRLFSLLSFQDRISFIQSSKGCASATERCWSLIAIEEYLHLAWSDTNGHPNPNRASYILGAALTRYIAQRQGITKQIQYASFTSMVQDRYGGLINRFRLFAVFLKTDMRNIGNLTLPDQLAGVSFDSIYPRNNQQLNGDLLLKNLLEMRTGTANDEPTLVASTENAIEAGVTCLSDLAPKVYSHWSRASLQSIATAAAIKKDFRALERIVERTLESMVETASKDVLERLPRLGPVLLSLANSQEKEELLKQAFKDYGERSPSPYFLGMAGVIQCKLKNFKEAASFFDRSLKLYGGQTPGIILAWAGRTQLELLNYLDADPLFEQALSKLSVQNAPVWLLGGAGRNKYLLKEYDKAESLLDQACLKITEKDGYIWIFEDAGRLKCLLRKFKEAEPLLDRSISQLKEPIPREVLADAGQLKLKFKKFKEADSLFDQARSKFGVEVPGNVLACAGRAKYELKNFKDAKPLFEAAILKFGENTPERATLLKFLEDVNSKLETASDGNGNEA